jgi:hypothetical protein
MTPAWCAASGGQCDEYISNVTIGSINNSSSCSGGYSNYSSISTKVYRGVPISLSVTNGNTYLEDMCHIWVDWNQDMDFMDLLESKPLGGGPTNFFTTLIPPENAPYGNHRLRIRIYWTESDGPEPCGTASFGEVEDYSLYIGRPGVWVGGAAGQAQNWNTAANWDDNVVPTAGTDVLIRGGLSNYPVLTSTGYCHDLEIRDGATVTVNSTGNLTINRYLADGQGAGGMLIVYGTCQVNGASLQRMGSGIQVKNGGTLMQY